MPNNYFQFKEFTVKQDQCAMKVTTDGCLFGGFVAARIADYRLQIANCLDIGAGTGLLSLLLAQKTTAIIDAVEIDAAAFAQAKDNFEQSPWKDRLVVYNADILAFDAAKKYDCIISNPPFFEDDLRSVDANKNNAKHDSALTLKQLLKAIHGHLNEKGIFFVLLPYRRVAFFLEEAVNMGFSLKEQLNIRQTPTHNYFRTIVSFTRDKAEVSLSEITIKNNDKLYTPEFIALLKDYYLHL